MGRNVLHVIETGNHIKLREDCQCLKPPRECLEDPIQGPMIVHNETQYNGCKVQIVMWKTIRLGIIRLKISQIKYQFIWPFESHMIDGGSSNPNEDEAHHIEVEGAPVMLDDHIGVAGEKNY